MKKEKLIKYISGNATSQEEKEVLRWLYKSEQNLKYFAGLKSMWIYNNMPESGAEDSDIKALEEILKGGRGVNKRLIIYRYLLYAASVVILASLSLNLISLSKKDGVKEEMLKGRVELSDIPEGFTHTLYTNKGVKGAFVLPDGSKVWLNSDSKITFPDKFTGPTREVLISGEVFFDVKSDSLKPMIVNTNRGFIVKVTGTKFNIRSYDNDEEAQTTLFSGSIKLIRRDPKSDKELVTNLKPEESFLFSDNRVCRHIKQSDTTKQGAWKRGELIFESTPVSEVIKILERWHGAEFRVNDDKILKYRLTATFKSESLVQILEMIKYSSFIDYEIKENRVTLKKPV